MDSAFGLIMLTIVDNNAENDYIHVGDKLEMMVLAIFVTNIRLS